MFKRGKQQNNQSLTLIDHLTELRRRIIVVAISLILGIIVGFYFAKDLLTMLMTIPGELVYLYPGEAFFAHLKISLVLGIIIVSPVIMYQVLAFIMPGLEKQEKRALIIGLPAGVMLFVLGVFFAYRIILPLAYKFFMGFGTESLEALISVGSYISFVISMLLPFGLIFELPLLVILLTGIGMITPMFLTRNRKFTVLVVFVVSAFLTPPDILSQFLMAGPLLLLYELSIQLSRVVYWRRKKRQELDND